jgi:hypothetical protein
MCVFQIQKTEHRTRRCTGSPINPAPGDLVVRANNYKRSIIVDADEARIIKILETEKVPEVSEENLLKYRKYLLQHLDPKAIFTGREDFPWEEKYVFGPGSRAEYEKLKKTHPSYTDEYEQIDKRCYQGY